MTEKAREDTKKRLETVYDEVRPSRADLRRHDRAVRAYNDWKDFGRLPEAGGTMDQPAIWHVWIRTIESAIRDAEEDREA